MTDPEAERKLQEKKLIREIIKEELEKLPRFKNIERRLSVIEETLNKKS